MDKLREVLIMNYLLAHKWRTHLIGNKLADLY